ncbi:ras-related protein RHN1-like [Histomonas meleagridis]|uniref:ras-related protein RHN1-like n=1 Tax=Histomonas meleagridis TaxID=135588 RepID=UPI0035599811|nr:ras-related protein RHN1-like [Histomonas meleagridis]KAH0799755.1 ras-related protein RHN1-like [Histomonas meleagridis]
MRTANRVRCEKVVLIGAASSGKTSILTRFAQGKFSQETEATIGASFIPKVINVDGTDIKLDIWDTGGSEKYRSLAPLYYRDARAAIIVYDITNENSFREAEQWCQEFRERGTPNAIIFCAANKCDLEPQRQVSKKMGEEFIFQNQILMLQNTSALTGEGINELFNNLGKELLQLPPTDSGEEIQIIEAENGKGTSKGGCDC